MAWQPGDTLQDGKYTIDKVLGKGGFGITYRVRDKNGQKFVVKTLNDATQASEHFFKLQQDFMNEALRLVQFKHPHIVRVYQLLQEMPLQGQRQGFLGRPESSFPLICTLMEYIEGIDLGEYVNRKGALSEDEAVKYICQIGEALSVVHQQGILHRDVKPENIMLREGTSEAVLIDFGIAREFVQDQTQLHTQMFTPGFAPIEQYRLRAKRGNYTDIYALASTLYYLVTGIAPPDVCERMMDAVSLKPPCQIVPNLSNRVESAILKGMELQPEKRPQSIQEWLEMLTDARRTPPPPVPVAPAPPKGKSIFPKGDYQRLEKLLAEGKWREANEATANRMLEVAGKIKEGWLRVEDIDKFPCEDLRTIDQLWVSYSYGHFGFSVQKRIYQSLGGTKNYNPKVWKAFGERVGWCKEGEWWKALGERIGWYEGGEWLSYSDLSFNISAQQGHLPYWTSPVKGVRGCVSLFSRVETCKL